MKKIVRRAIIAVVMVVVTGAAAFAQTQQEDSAWGATPEQRQENMAKLSYLQSEVTVHKDFDRAAIYVKELLNDAPAAHSGIYIYGVQVYRNKIARAKSIEEKKVFVDSLMLIYDRRVENYGNQMSQGVSFLQMKARDYAVVNPTDREGVRKFFKEAVEASGEGVGADLVLEYFQQLINDYKAENIKAEELLSAYQQLAPLMASAEESKRDGFNTLFATSGAASCEALEELYAKLIAAEPDNIDVLTKAYNLMSMIDCKSDFYIGVAEKYYAAAPSSAVAIHLASVFEDKLEYDKALQYLNEMLPQETDPGAKSNLYVRVAASELGANRGSAAAQAARSAIELNPENGFAHWYLAQAYIKGAAGCGGFAAQTAYWLVDDELARARQLLAGEASMIETIDQQRANARANFPSYDVAIFEVEGYKDGNRYTVSCGWVSGVTTIRSR